MYVSQKVLEIVPAYGLSALRAERPEKKAPAAAQTHLNRAIIRNITAYSLSALRAERPVK